jgi:hypothetical protein
LYKLRGMIDELQGDSKFLNKQLSGFDQREMDVVDIVGSQLWSTLTKRLTRALYFFYKNQVVLYHEGAILQKEKHGLLSLVLPIAGFAHQTNVHVDNHLDTQLTVSWFDCDDSSTTDAASALFALIQLALMCQSDDIDKGSETPPMVQVEVPAEGNERATIVLSPDQFSKLTDISGCDACDHLIEFKKVVFTAKQQAGLLKTAGQIKLTDCVFVGDGQALSETLAMGANGLVLWQLKLYEKFPFGTDQALILIKSCNKTIVIGGGAAVDLFKQECLVARLKEKAASDGLFYSWKFDFGTFSSSEKELFRDFLAAIFTRKLGLLEDHATFAATKAAIIQQLSEAYDQDDPDGETYDWPFDMVDILPRSQHQVELASYVKEKIEPLAFVERQPPAPYPPSPTGTDAKQESLAALFFLEKKEEDDKEVRNCILCTLRIGKDETPCPHCECRCMSGNSNAAFCESCRKSNRDKCMGDDWIPPSASTTGFEAPSATVSSVASSVSGGFTFGAPSAAGMSVASSVSGGFTFGDPSAAGTSVASSVSGGFTFGAPSTAGTSGNPNGDGGNPSAPNGRTSTEAVDAQEQPPGAPRHRSRRNLNLQPEIRRRSRRNITQPEFEQQDDPDGYARGQARRQG